LRDRSSCSSIFRSVELKSSHPSPLPEVDPSSGPTLLSAYRASSPRTGWGNLPLNSETTCDSM
jgi:hypothetical protein